MLWVWPLNAVHCRHDSLSGWSPTAVVAITNRHQHRHVAAWQSSQSPLEILQGRDKEWWHKLCKASPGRRIVLRRFERRKEIPLSMLWPSLHILKQTTCCCCGAVQRWRPSARALQTWVAHCGSGCWSWARKRRGIIHFHFSSLENINSNRCSFASVYCPID